MSGDSTFSCEPTVSEPPTVTDLKMVLQGTKSILYEAREDVPVVWFQKHEKETLVPGCFRLSPFM